METKITIEREKLTGLYDILTHYPQISKEQVTNEMEKVFGRDFFKPVTERIKTFEDALKELGADHPFVESYTDYIESMPSVGQADSDILAYLQLRIICAALNEGWEPTSDEGEVRWYPWHWLYDADEVRNMREDEKKRRCMMSTGDYQTEYAGFACACSASAPSDAAASVGSRLCLKSESVADYCGRQFISLWADFKLVRK